MLCTDRDFQKRVVALYIFAWLVFATLPLSLSLTQAKRFSENKHTLHWHKAKICKSVEKNFYLSSSHSLTWDKCLIWYIADHHSAARKIPWDWESAERRWLFSAQSLGVLSCPVVRAKSGKRRESESFSLTSHLTSRERLGLRLSYFLRIRVYCCCCRRCYCWWCLLSCWGRATSQGKLVTRVVSVQKLIGFFALELANSLPLLIATIRVVDHPLNNPNIFTNLSFLHVIILEYIFFEIGNVT